MIITLDTATVETNELTALIALCASLGGRLPAAHEIAVKITADTSEVRQTLAEAIEAAPPVDPVLASEMLLAQEAVRAENVLEQTCDEAQLDADGIPWDERIHSGNPTLTADGRWRKKRGVSEVYYGQIHAELSGIGTSSNPTSSNTAETQAAPPPPVSVAPTAPPADVPNVPVTPTVAPPAPTAAPSAPVENAPVENAPVATDSAGRWPDYATFVQAVSAIRQPTIPYAELNDMAQALGLVKFIDLRERADLWAQFYGMAGGQ